MRRILGIVLALAGSCGGSPYNCPEPDNEYNFLIVHYTPSFSLLGSPSQGSTGLLPIGKSIAYSPPAPPIRK